MAIKRCLRAIKLKDAVWEDERKVVKKVLKRDIRKPLKPSSLAELMQKEAALFEKRRKKAKKLAKLQQQQQQAAEGGGGGAADGAGGGDDADKEGMPPPPPRERGLKAGGNSKKASKEDPSTDTKLIDDDRGRELSATAKSEELIDAGWKRVMDYGKLKGYRPPNGGALRSLAKAWREHCSLEEEDNEEEEADDGNGNTAKDEGGDKPQATNGGAAKPGIEMVGQVLEVWWPLDKAWYACKVLKYKESNGKHQLEYLDDDKKETVMLSGETYRACTDPRYVDTSSNNAAEEGGGEVDQEDQPIKRKRGRPPANPQLNALMTPGSSRQDSQASLESMNGSSVHDDDASTVGGGDDASSVFSERADLTLPSPKTPSEEKGECARTLGRSLVQRYRQQRRESQALRRASLTTSTIMTPSYWQPEELDTKALTGGSVASRGSRSEKRKLASTLGEFSGAGFGSSKRRKKGNDGGEDELSALAMNELGLRKKRLIFGKSAIHSRGLYAAEPIEKEDFVVEYLGEYVRGAVAEARETHYRRYGWGDDYIFRVDTDLLVDATRRGGLARYANHCCEPNAYTRIINAGGKKRIVLYSKERIEVGEEITYDYHFDLEEDRSNAIPCCCGAKKCRGFLN